MKTFIRITLVLFTVAAVISCGTASKLPAASKEDKDLFKAIQAIDKSNDAEARRSLPTLHDEAIQRHEDNLASYRNSDNEDSWLKIVEELEALQRIALAIKASPGALKLVTPKEDYASAIREAREAGASHHYDRGVDLLGSSFRQDARKAYKAFQAVNKLSPNYRNTSSLLKEAREKGILDVVINPVQSRGYVYSNYGNNADRFHRDLVRDLGGQYGNINSGARFYTDWEARSQNVKPDWVVDLNWENVYISQPYTRTSTRNLSKQVEDGKDSTGKVRYKTVTATLHITQRTASARADMEYRVVDLDEGKDVQWNRIPVYLDLNTEFARYTGDSRALSDYDWALVNNRQRQYLDERAIMEAMYGNVYPQLRDRIERVTRWE
jgi:hypothetical protein